VLRIFTCEDAPEVEIQNREGSFAFGSVTGGSDVVACVEFIIIVFAFRGKFQ
jgi:hypothetical protein